MYVVDMKLCKLPFDKTKYSLKQAFETNRSQNKMRKIKY